MIAEAWATRYARNPKNWAFLDQFFAMFFWANPELITALTHPGAVFLLASGLPELRDMQALNTARDNLLARTTLTLIFTTAGRKGLSMHTIEEHHRVLWTHRSDLIPWLVIQRIWTLEELENWLEESLRISRSADDRSWFATLHNGWSSIHPNNTRSTMTNVIPI